MAQHKRDGACRRLVVTGCLPQRYQEELAKELPEVDIFIGTGDYPRIAEIIAEKKVPVIGTAINPAARAPPENFLQTGITLPSRRTISTSPST